jgi:hypothetical protein
MKYIVAVVLPVVGVVLAIRLFARSQSGPATALLLTSVLSWVAWMLVLQAA